MVEAVARAGRRGLGVFWRLGRAHGFALQLLGALVPALGRPRPIVVQLFRIGVLMVPLTALAGLLAGMLLVLHGHAAPAGAGATDGPGVLAARSLGRDFGPVLVALLFAGRFGTALSAEIGLMRKTEQLAALEMMAVDPLRRVLAPRFVAGLAAMPLLAGLFLVAGVVGGYLVALEPLGLEPGPLWPQVLAAAQARADLLVGGIKSVAFGAVVTWIALFQGKDCMPTSVGVSRATTRTVVYASLAVLALELLLTVVVFGH